MTNQPAKDPWTPIPMGELPSRTPNEERAFKEGQYDAFKWALSWALQASSLDSIRLRLDEAVEKTRFLDYDITDPLGLSRGTK